MIAFLMLTSYAVAGEVELPIWADQRHSWGEKIGNPDEGITGEYLLSDYRPSNRPPGIIFYPYLHIKMKDTDRGVSKSEFRKDPTTPWENLYINHFRLTLDDNFTIDLQTHPALSHARAS